MALQRYILQRVLQVVPMILLVSIVLFFAMRLIPGGPMAVYARGNLPPEQIAAIRLRLGLDDPLFIQYLRWLGPAVHGDLGFSFSTGRPVLSEIGDRVIPTLYLMGSTFLVVLFLSIPLGTLSAIRQYSRIDVALTTLSFAGAAMPVFWLALVLLVVNAAIRNPATGAPFFPAGGMVTLGKPTNVSDLLSHLALPMLALGLGWVSWYSRYVRSSMLDVVHQDYVRTARAKGLPEYLVIFKHAFKNAAMPLLTVIALDLPYLFAGALFTETIFGWPGMGFLFFHAVTVRDYPMMMGVVVVIAFLVLIGNLLADIGYAYLDPRVRFQR